MTINSNVTVDDKIIAIMGPTGAGKSNLIDTLANHTVQWAGSQLKSVTQEVRTLRLPNPVDGRNTLVLVDTPGFDDTTRSDMEILTMIADWLQKTYKGGVKLAGIIYVHRITDNRMGGTPHRNLRMFGELCGENAAGRVALVTTMWDKLKEMKVGEARENELRANYWKMMIERDATTHRFRNSREDAFNIVMHLLRKQSDAEAVLLQQELVDFHRRLNETQAGRTLYSDLQNLLSRQKETLSALADQARTKDNPKLVAELESEKERITKEFEKTFTQVQELKISFGRRIWLFFAKKLPTVRPDDQIIAFMGPTGAGKSNLIDLLAKNKVQWAGERLQSVTQEVRSVRLPHPVTKSKTLVLVDTPGFDDTARSDMEILETIATWLKKTYKQGVKLAGIVYVHRITDNRMAGTPHRNLRMFGELCGEKAAQRVVLVTTMWDKLKNPEVGGKRERELHASYWKVMLEKNATSSRFSNTEKDAWKIVTTILEKHEKLRAEAVLLQEELVDFRRRLNETQAGQTLYTDLQKLLAKQKETLTHLAEQAKRANNAKLAADFEEQRRITEAALEKTFQQVDALKVPFSRRVRLFFAKKLPTNPLKIEEEKEIRG
ncbi:hypothetical protein NLJ89_g3074 [Agrocybe chaxingu]|uniref:G domain-containing protein n=1 Tax=Agrocybe chaxingu TaxID=84603 RepID=A0A9W8K5L0_9AGAR|nr:hypothetical protein NLJ89_g3074 [Agrocybe chaxingu]